MHGKDLEKACCIVNQKVDQHIAGLGVFENVLREDMNLALLAVKTDKELTKKALSDMNTYLVNKFDDKS
jgi:hypothetical protein